MFVVPHSDPGVGTAANAAACGDEDDGGVWSGGEEVLVAESATALTVTTSVRRYRNRCQLCWLDILGCTNGILLRSVLKGDQGICKCI